MASHKIELSADELRGLGLIARTRVCASYWEDDTIQRYRALALVESDGRWIKLTEAGRLHAALREEGLTLDHPMGRPGADATASPRHLEARA